MSALHRIHQLFWTVRYLRPNQITARILRRLRRAVPILRGRSPASIASNAEFSFRTVLSGLSHFELDGPWRNEAGEAIGRAKESASLRFIFLNRPADLSARPGWSDPDLSRLWRYHLHYFDYVRDLFVSSVCGESSRAYQAFRSLARSWIEDNRRFVGDGWHPYTISLRLVNWLDATVVFSIQLGQDENFRVQLLSSLREQAWVLRQDLETDVRGNHLLANLRAVICYGLAFKDGEAAKWLRDARDLLDEELAEQVLADGGHFERNPGYHLVVLKHCLEIALVLRANGETPSSRLESSIRRMLDFLVDLRTPDGGLPLLKDTAWDECPRPEDLLAIGALYFDEPAYKQSGHFGLYPYLVFGQDGWDRYQRLAFTCRARGSLVLEASGYCVWRDENKEDYFVLDFGEPCPEYLPAHAHADLLSYELISGGRRIITDSGVYEYAAGSWRDYFRSTRAHNTVVVQDCDQSEMWDSFRVARRARPGKVRWAIEEQSALVQAEHDGYKRLADPVIHRRTVAWRRDRFWAVVDELRGRGTARLVNCIHFSPGLSIVSDRNTGWRIEGCGQEIWINPFGEEDRRIVRGRMESPRQGWYSERFGRLESNDVLELEAAKPLPVCFGYVISRHSAAESCVISSPGMNRILVRHGNDEFELVIPEDAPPTFE